MGDRLFIGSCSGSFFALDRNDGGFLWSHDTSLDGESANFHGSPVIAAGRIVVGSDSGLDGFLYGFDLETGEVRWQQSTDGGFPSNVVQLDSRAFAVSMSGELRCVEIDDGQNTTMSPSFSFTSDGT